MGFTKRFYLNIQTSARSWKPLEPLIYTTEDGAMTIEVLPGEWEHDYTSSPRLTWSLIPPVGVYSSSAELHDALYMGEAFDRETCDRLFLESMKSLGVPWWKRNVMWAAVRAGGWVPWNRHNPQKVREFREKYIKITHHKEK